MSDIKYSSDHEYVKIDGGNGIIGVSIYAQEQLGDIVYVELPNVGEDIKKGDEIAVIESVKAASELYSPVSGTIVAINEKLNDEPAFVNLDAEGEGWIFKVALSNVSELDELMNEAAYNKHIS